MSSGLIASQHNPKAPTADKITSKQAKLNESTANKQTISYDTAEAKKIGLSPEGLYSNPEQKLNDEINVAISLAQGVSAAEFRQTDSVIPEDSRDEFFVEAQLAANEANRQKLASRFTHESESGALNRLVSFASASRDLAADVVTAPLSVANEIAFSNIDVSEEDSQAFSSIVAKRERVEQIQAQLGSATLPEDKAALEFELDALSSHNYTPSEKALIGSEKFADIEGYMQVQDAANEIRAYKDISHMVNNDFKNHVIGKLTENFNDEDKSIATKGFEAAKIVLENPSTILDTTIQSLPHMILAAKSLPIAGVSMYTKIKDEALAEYRRINGVEASGDERLTLNLAAAAAATMAVASDRIVAQGGRLFKSAPATTTTQKAKQIVTGTVTGGVSEGVSETSEALLTQYASKQDVDKLNTGAALAEGTLAAGSGAGLSATINTASTAKQAASDLVGFVKGKEDAPVAAPAYEQATSQVQDSLTSEDLNKSVEAIKTHGTVAERSAAASAVGQELLKRTLDENSSTEQKAEAKEALLKVVALKEEYLAELHQDNATQLESIKGKQSDDITVEEAQGALQAVISSPETVEESVATKLSGSKHLTNSQKALIGAITDPTSPVSKALSKTPDEVNRDIWEGDGEQFIGLREYSADINTAIAANDVQTASALLAKLYKFNQHMQSKASTGLVKGKKLGDKTHAIVKEEAKAINLVFSALSDSASQVFPELTDSIKTVQERNQQGIKDLATKSVPTTERSTTTRRSRINQANVAINTLLNTSNEPAAGTEKELREVQLKLVKDLGINTKTIESHKAKLVRLEALESIDKLSEEQAKELRTIGNELSQFQRDIVRSLGKERFEQVVSQQAPDTDVFTAESAAELNTEVNEGTYHKAEKTVSKDLTENSQFNKYGKIVSGITEYVDNAADTALTAEQREIYDNLPANLDVFSEGTQGTYNQAVELYNQLEVKGEFGQIAADDSTLKSTTPNNRTTQNTLDEMPVNSTVGNAFRFGGEVKSILQTEEHLFTKLANKESEQYKHITRDLSQESLEALEQLTGFVQQFHKAVDKVAVPLADAKNKKGVTYNDLFQDFVLTNGKLDDNVAETMAVVVADWFAANGTGTFYNDEETIAKYLYGNAEATISYEEAVAFRQGVPEHIVVEDLGKSIVKLLGLTENTDIALTHQLPQLRTSLGIVALESAKAMGNTGVIQNIYVDGDNNATGITKPKGQHTTLVRATPNHFSKSNPNPEVLEVNSKGRKAIAGISDTAVSSSILGDTFSYIPVYMDGEVMPSASKDSWNSAEQADAIDKYNKLEYVPDQKYLGILNNLDEAFKHAMVDFVPEAGQEHEGNALRNKAIRDNINQEYVGLTNILSRMEETGSAAVRFFSRSAKANKRMSQLGTDGNPQNSKLIRHIFKLKDMAVTIDPSNKDAVLAYMWAVMEGLDIDTTEGKGVEKSTDGSAKPAFEAAMKDPIISAAIETIRSGENDKDAIQAVLKLPSLKKEGAAGMAGKLDALIAMAAYSPDTAFEVNIGTEHDGITNGIGIGALQYAIGQDVNERRELLARVGIFLEDGKYKNYGEFASDGNPDSYVQVGNHMTGILTDPRSNPNAEEDVLPVVSTKNATFKVKNIKHNPVLDVLDNTQGSGTRKASRFTVSKDLVDIRITESEFNSIGASVDFFLEQRLYDKATGKVQTLREQVEEVVRSFAKNPLMIFNYGAGIKGIKKAVSAKILSGVMLSIESAMVQAGNDPEVLEASLQAIEKSLNNLNVISGNTWKIDRDNPYKMLKESVLLNDAAFAVDFTYGYALEKTFNELYGEFKSVSDALVSMSRVATSAYKLRLADAVKAKTKELGVKYLTVAQEAEIKESLVKHSPMIATALSEDKYVDGIWLPKGESTRNRNEEGFLDEATDRVKLELGTGSKQFATYSNKIKDPGVSAVPTTVQSLDATVIVKLMAERAMVNVHDAKIENPLSAVSGTKSMNKHFIQAMTDYSMVDEMNTTMEQALEGLPASFMTRIQNDLNMDDEQFFDVMGNARTAHTNVMAKREIFNKLNMLVGQYYGGSKSTYSYSKRRGKLTIAEAQEKLSALNPNVPTQIVEEPVNQPEQSETLSELVAQLSENPIEHSNQLFEAYFAKDAELKALSTSIVAAAPKGIKIVSTTSDKAGIEGFDNMRGAYDHTENTIYLNTDNLGSNGVSNVVETLFHEFDHAASVDALYRENTGTVRYRTLGLLHKRVHDYLKTGVGLTQAQNDLLNNVPQEAIDQIFGDDETTTEHLAEFMAWGKSNRALRNFLKSVRIDPETPSTKTFYDRIIEVSLSLLGIKRDRGSLNLYDALLAVSEPFINATSTNTTDVKVPEHAQYKAQAAFNAEGNHRLTAGNVNKIFDALASIGHKQVTASVGHQNKLKSILGMITPAIQDIAVTVKTDPTVETSGSFNGSSAYITVNTSAKANNIEMSPQETYVHELLHAFLSKADKGSYAYRQLSKIYDHAVEHLKPSHFLPAGVTTAADMKAAEERYKHTLFNAIQGGSEYKTSLGVTKQRYHADPVEEFTVMSMTNAPLMDALTNMYNDVGALPEFSAKEWENSIGKYLALGISKVSGDIVNIKGKNANAQMMLLLEQLAGIHANKASTIINMAKQSEQGFDATTEWLNDKLKSVTGYTGIKIANSLGVPVIDKIKSGIREAAGKSVLGKSKLATAIGNEFTSGRLGLNEAVKLLSKSTELIERKSTQLHAWIKTHLDNTFPNITEEEHDAIYRKVLETGASSLLTKYDSIEISNFLTNPTDVAHRITDLENEIKTKGGTAFRHLRNHSEDLAHFMVNGERLYAGGIYKNVASIIDMRGMDRKPRYNKNDLTPLVDELVTMYAIQKSTASVDGLFHKGKFGDTALEILLNYHNDITQVAKETTFKDNEYNMRKGYLREEMDTDIIIKVAPTEDIDRMTNLGFTLVGEVHKDPANPDKTPMSYYKNMDGGTTAYLTGIMSTNSASASGADLFPLGADKGGMDALSVSINQEQMIKNKRYLLNEMYSGKLSKLKGGARSSISDATFDSNGNIHTLTHIMSNRAKDEYRNRSTDFTSALGYTLAGVSRRNSTDTINREMVDLAHKTFAEDFKKYPHEFVKLHANSGDKQYREAWKLLPQDAKEYAKSKFGGNFLVLRREQVDIMVGYRKFSVRNLHWDDTEYASSVRNLAKYINNMAAIMFNNRVGISMEEYWSSFVRGAKDVLVVKSGVVTMGNVVSNISLLWLSGISPVQSVKYHKEAYEHLNKYVATEKEVFLLDHELTRKGLSQQEVIKLSAKRSKLRQELYNNPVRELVEAGMYKTIVEDVDVSEKASKARDKFEQLAEPLLKRTPDVVVEATKQLLMTHDTQAYQFMRDMAQMSDFAGRYALHKHNMQNGMSLEESLRDIDTTFVNYDIPTHRGIQYLNDIGLLGFTKYLFRTQQVILKRFGENPARLATLMAVQGTLGVDLPDVTDAIIGMDTMVNRIYTPGDWLKASTQSLSLSWL